MPVVTDYTALLSGSYWNGIEVTGRPVIVTYSFPATAAAYLADVDGFTPETIASFQAFTAAEQAQARAALGEWAAASGLVFIEVAPGKGDLNFQLVDLDTTSAPSYAGAGGIGFYPFGDWNFFTYPSFSGDLDSSGDVFMNTQFEAGGEVAYGTLLHEIGHAIGLKHPTEVVTDLAANPVVVHDEVLASDDPALTVMAETGDGSGDPVHLHTLDQQAAAFVYGAAGTGGVFTASASGANSVSAWSWDASVERLTQTGFAGADTIRGSSVKDTLNGLDGDDRLFGLADRDILNGGAGNDLLYGGAGADTMTGGTGDDTYAVDDAKDKVVEQADGGYDIVLAFANHTLAANVEQLQVYGSGHTGRGNGLGNAIFGDGTLASNLYGLAGNDYIVAGNANDILDGGAGIDTMFGGAGNDRYTVDDAADVVREDSTPGVDDGGSDSVKALVSWTLGAFIENLTLAGTSAIDGTGNELANKLTGNTAVNHLTGGGGGDELDGGQGADILDGGEGNDTYIIDAADTFHDSGSTGTDTVVAKGNFVLGSGTGIENVRATAGTTNNLSLTGDELANRLTGNLGNNTLRGLDGKDTLLGDAGNDRLEGGLGSDTLTGGDGADVFAFAATDSPASGSPVSYDTVTDFLTAVDRIDLSTVGTGGLPAAAYAETTVASTGFAAALAGAGSVMADGLHSVVFVASPTDGWLFWNTDGDLTTAEQAVRLQGLGSVDAFQRGDVI